MHTIIKTIVQQFKSQEDALKGMRLSGMPDETRDLHTPITYTGPIRELCRHVEWQGDVVRIIRIIEWHDSSLEDSLQFLNTDVTIRCWGQPQTSCIIQL